MSGTIISTLPAASGVNASDLVAKVTLGSPNITQRATISQVAAGIGAAGFPGTVSIGTGGTSGTNAVNYAQFNPTASTPGLIYLPGGVEMQWGQTPSSSNLYTLIFPVAFRELWSLQLTPCTLGTFGCSIYVSNGVQASFNIFNTSTGAGATSAFFWFAIGAA